MLLGGDEFGRTQHGNNNAYCQDNDNGDQNPITCQVPLPAAGWHCLLDSAKPGQPCNAVEQGRAGGRRQKPGAVRQPGAQGRPWLTPSSPCRGARNGWAAAAPHSTCGRPRVGGRGLAGRPAASRHGGRRGRALAGGSGLRGRHALSLCADAGGRQDAVHRRPGLARAAGRRRQRQPGGRPRRIPLAAQRMAGPALARSGCL
jgi:hypothetical protein